MDTTFPEGPCHPGEKPRCSPDCACAAGPDGGPCDRCKALRELEAAFKRYGFTKGQVPPAWRHLTDVGPVGVD